MVKDLIRCTAIEKPLDALVLPCNGQYSTYCSDTLAVSYIDSDPFIMKECPHIYFGWQLVMSFPSYCMRVRRVKKTNLVLCTQFWPSHKVCCGKFGHWKCHAKCFNSAQDD
ncbi:DNA polymerase delta small subunit [Lucilia cuprina]|nr:DNA polymerase delta small subunit [Lucilia cuprina]